MVRVKTGLAEPKHGWGSVKPQSVGKVTAMIEDGVKCKVDFPEQGGWTAVVAELELAVSA